MTFLRPELLLIGPAAALVLLLTLVLQWRRLARLGGTYGDLVQMRLAPRDLQRFPTLRMVCLLAASFALAFAAADPRPATPEPAEPAEPMDIAVAVDISRSMSVEDVGSSRIERAREVIARLTEALPAARIVLVVFADWPYTLVPPTDDPSLVRYFARSLSAELVLDRDQGTSFASAFAHARAALESRPRDEARRAVVVLSDGGVHESLAEVLDAAGASRGDTPIWTAGLGTVSGMDVPSPTGTVLDQSGRPVLSRLEEDLLREIARAGGGQYHDVSTAQGLAALIEGLGVADDDSLAEREVTNAAFWLTLASIPLLLLEGLLDTGRSVFTRRSAEKVA